ncbi:hypothetical protein ASD94_16405 [Acidovorax sp. Root70]|nr:hypothetical protein ASD94_16405 [Acidovorax sp. Root70]
MWALAAGASALSLGSGSGTVVLGAPVDLSFELQPDPGTDVASSCVTAKLVAGDNAISDSKVRVIPLPEVRGRPSGVRVLASVSLDEPVLTVTLSAGCNGKTTRGYTFLSELPTTVTRSASASPVDLSRLPAASPGAVTESQPVPSVGGGAAAASAAATGIAQGTRPSGKVAVPARAARPSTAASRATGSAAAAKPAARVAAAAPGKSAGAGTAPAVRSRLVVEPLDTSMDGPVALRSTSQLPAPPSEEASAARTQAAAVWKSLNVQPDELQKDGERLKALESDTAALRSQAAQDRAAAARLQQQLASMEQERFPATLVYALGGLLLLALLGVAWMWSRVRSASDKAVRAWRDSVALGVRGDAAAHEEALGLTPHPGDTWLPSETQPRAAAVSSEPAALAPNTVATATMEPRFVATSPAASAPAPLQAKPVFAPPSAAVAPHIVNPEELFDIQQQAEFFVSVGEHQQAIEVLKHHIAQHRETSPLAYLELLRLYHTLSRVDEFAQLRMQFMQAFNAQVPEFAGFHRTGRMLYHYTDALAEIEAEWSTSAVLGLLEKFLFRRTGAEAVEPFDLAAYDDLLLLLAIAQTTPASARGAPPPRKRTTPLLPPPSEALVAPPAPAPVVAPHDDLPLDSLAASLEFDFAMKAQQAPAPAPFAAATPGPHTSVGQDSRGIPLDLDLSDPPHLTLSDLPPVPVTSPPPAGQAVGFGMENDLMELRLELEQMKKADRK